MRLFFVISTILALASCAKHTAPCTYELPSHYMGWVLVEYEKDGAPELPVVSGRRILRIDQTGHLATNSMKEIGTTSEEFVSVGRDRIELRQTLWGSGGDIWARSTGNIEVPGKSRRLYEVFFIGSESEYKEQASHAPTPENP